MTREEFANVTTVIANGCGKTLSAQAHEVYWAMFGELQAEVFQAAAVLALHEPLYNAFPPISLLARMVAKVLMGNNPSGVEAFQIALKAIGNCDIDIDGSARRALDSLPERVSRAVQAFGFMALYELPGNAMETARAQFARIYDAQLEREQRHLMLPSSVQKILTKIGHDAEVAKVLASDGEAPSRVKIALAKVGKDVGS